MLDTIRTKIRALIADITSSDFQTFSYTNSAVFTLAEDNIQSITQVTKNGNSLESGEYSYDSTNNEITILVAPVAGDIIIVKYTYYKYSDTELKEFIRASLVWISIYSYCETDFELEDDIYPTPSNQQQDLIALIASILIKPDYNRYELPNLKVVYNNRISKEEKIEKLINRFQRGLGVNSILEFN